MNYRMQRFMIIKLTMSIYLYMLSVLLFAEVQSLNLRQHTATQQL
jgi:hypothetical protein